MDTLTPYVYYDYVEYLTMNGYINSYRLLQLSKRYQDYVLDVVHRELKRYINNGQDTDEIIARPKLADHDFATIEQDPKIFIQLENYEYLNTMGKLGFTYPFLITDPHMVHNYEMTDYDDMYIRNNYDFAYPILGFFAVLVDYIESPENINHNKYNMFYKVLKFLYNNSGVKALEHTNNIRDIFDIISDADVIQRYTINTPLSDIIRSEKYNFIVLYNQTNTSFNLMEFREVVDLIRTYFTSSNNNHYIINHPIRPWKFTGYYTVNNSPDKILHIIDYLLHNHIQLFEDNTPVGTIEIFTNNDIFNRYIIETILKTKNMYYLTKWKNYLWVVCSNRGYRDLLEQLRQYP